MAVVDEAKANAQQKAQLDYNYQQTSNDRQFSATDHWQLSPKGKGLDTCYTATYMSQTRDQLRFTISEVAADWHEPMVPQRIM